MKFSPLKFLLCIIKASFNFIRYGAWFPHVFVDSAVVKVPIIAGKKKFRIADNFTHGPNERLYPSAAYIESTCICCGRKQYSWAENYETYIKENAEEVDNKKHDT